MYIHVVQLDNQIYWLMVQTCTKHWTFLIWVCFCLYTLTVLGCWPSPWDFRSNMIHITDPYHVEMYWSSRQGHTSLSRSFWSLFGSRTELPDQIQTTLKPIKSRKSCLFHVSVRNNTSETILAGVSSLLAWVLAGNWTWIEWYSQGQSQTNSHGVSTGTTYWTTKTLTEPHNFVIPHWTPSYIPPHNATVLWLTCYNSIYLCIHYTRKMSRQVRYWFITSCHMPGRNSSSGRSETGL